MAEKTSLVVALETESIEQLNEIRAYRTYKGTNPEYSKKAKTAIGVIGAYVRLRATLANERTNELVARRLDGEVIPGRAIEETSKRRELQS